MKRRKALKNIGILGTTLASSPSVITLLQSCKQFTPDEKWIPLFHSENEAQFLKTLIDIILPANENLPSASSVNVHVFIDKYAKNILNTKQKTVYKETLNKAIQEILTLSKTSNVKDIQAKYYETFLKNYLTNTPNLSNNDEDQNSLIILPFQTVDLTKWVSQMIELVIWAYKTNEYVGEKILAYNPIPGQYTGCVDVLSATQGKAWSL